MCIIGDCEQSPGIVYNPQKFWRLYTITGDSSQFARVLGNVRITLDFPSFLYILRGKWEVIQQFHIPLMVLGNVNNRVKRKDSTTHSKKYFLKICINKP